MIETARQKAKAEPPPLRLLEVEPGTCCAGAWANITVTTWQSRGTVPAIERVARVGSVIRSECRSGISSIHLIREGAGLPSPEARAALVKLMNTDVETLACVGIVVGGTGFWASAVRSLITGMRAVSPRSYQLKLVGNIPELAAWLPQPHAARTGVAIDADELAAALHTANAWQAGDG
jgi:hypothetical protein